MLNVGRPDAASSRAKSGAICATSRSRRTPSRRCATPTTSSRVIREQDVLLHHPYESFDSVVDLITRAADDPDVLAIKQTLYRAGGDSPIVKALVRAAESGKQVTAIVELKARFDEESNIVWARMLEQSGRARRLRPPRPEDARQVPAHRAAREGQAPALRAPRRRATTTRRPRASTPTSRSSRRARTSARTSRALFNLLTGYSAPPKWNKLIVAPLGLHEAVLGLIAREAEHARAGRPARIVAKMNALVDADVIEALYRASQAGVPITLLVRGICCLRPGVPRVSETIEVRALVDRFLEHGRVFHFANGGKDEVYIASADWMPRNFHRRVEAMIPIEDPALRARLIEILQMQLRRQREELAAQVRRQVRARAAQAGAAAPPLAGAVHRDARERVKAADAAATGGRFHMHALPNGRGKLEGKSADARRSRRDAREGTKK